MRRLTAVITLILVAALAAGATAQRQFINDWRAEGRIITCALEQKTSNPASAVAKIKFQVGGNRPVLCIVRGILAPEINSWWIACVKYRGGICGAYLTGPLRITDRQVILRVKSWGPRFYQ